MTKRSLTDYSKQREKSIPLRIFKSSKLRFDALQKRLTMATGGTPLSQAQVMEYLLDLAEGKVVPDEVKLTKPTGWKE